MFEVGKQVFLLLLSEVHFHVLLFCCLSLPPNLLESITNGSSPDLVGFEVSQNAGLFSLLENQKNYPKFQKD